MRWCVRRMSDRASVVVSKRAFFSSQRILDLAWGTTLLQELLQLGCAYRGHLCKPGTPPLTAYSELSR